MSSEGTSAGGGQGMWQVWNWLRFVSKVTWVLQDVTKWSLSVLCAADGSQVGHTWNVYFILSLCNYCPVFEGVVYVSPPRMRMWKHMSIINRHCTAGNIIFINGDASGPSLVQDVGRVLVRCVHLFWTVANTLACGSSNLLHTVSLQRCFGDMVLFRMHDLPLPFDSQTSWSRILRDRIASLPGTCITFINLICDFALESLCTKSPSPMP